MATIEELTHALGGASFPATRDHLVNAAIDNGASQDIVAQLRSLPDDEYATIMNVWQALTPE